MYFKNRTAAGKKLAEKITERYSQDDTCTVVALSDGGVIVGAEIALALKCPLVLLLTQDLMLPGEYEPLAVVDQEGGMTYNAVFSVGQIEEFVAEYHNYIEQEKQNKFHILNRLLAQGEVIRENLLSDHDVFLVSDGLGTGLSLDAAADFLKPVRVKRLMIATPLASVPAVDRMHIVADEIFCLSVIENFMGVDHYYDDNHMPSHRQIVKTIKTIVKSWS